MNEQTLLVVDDEAAIRDMLANSLELAGFRVLLAENAMQALVLIADHAPDLVLLDWMLPGTSGIELARRLKREAATAELPVIMLTARSDEDNKIQGLDAGADDYVTKPFSTRELVSRVRAVLRRSSPLGGEQPLDCGGLVLDPVSQRITAHGQPLSLGPTEFRLLAFFMAHAERAYSRQQLLDQVWGSGVYVEDRTVDVHIRRLRKSLEPHGFAGLLQTVRGTGYRFSQQGLQEQD